MTSEKICNFFFNLLLRGMSLIHNIKIKIKGRHTLLFEKILYYFQGSTAVFTSIVSHKENTIRRIVLQHFLQFIDDEFHRSMTLPSHAKMQLAAGKVMYHGFGGFSIDMNS